MTPTEPKRGLVGQRIGGRFELLDLITAGGMADLYRAVQRPIGRPVAVKVLYRGDPELVIRFQREAEIVSRLRCPYTVTLYDYGEEEDYLYIAMEFLVGETLFDALGRRGSMPPGEVVDIAEQVLASLQEAHALGIIHRDLKPENVFLVAPESQGGAAGPRSPHGVFVKVLDFGLAKLLVSGKEGVTAAGFTVGTPGYMSPEQLVGGQIDGRSDLYSLGVLMYQALTGGLPYEGMAVLSGTPPRPLKVPGRSVPQGFSDVIMEALSADPAQRPQGASQMLAAVREATAGQMGPGPRNVELPTERSEPRALLGWRLEPDAARSKIGPAVELTISNHHGRMERNGGPFAVASFAVSQDAIAAAVDLSGRTLTHGRKAGAPPSLRMAVHHGYLVSQGSGLGGDSVALLGRVIDQCGEGEVLVTRGAFEEAKPVLGLGSDKVGVCDSEIGHPIDLFRVPVAVAVPPARPQPGIARERNVTPTSWPSRPVVVRAASPRSRWWIALIVFLIAAGIGVGAALWRAGRIVSR